MKQTIKTSRVAGQLEKMFRALNNRFFDGELPEVVISLKKTAGAYGHFTTGKVWKTGEERRYEINISSASLNQECAFLAGVLVHEMVHEYCAEHGIKDTSNNGVYHNKNFKHIAETHGLEVEHHPKYGWTITSPGLELLDFVEEQGWQDFQMVESLNLLDVLGTLPKGVNSGAGAETRTKKPSSTRKSSVIAALNQYTVDLAKEQIRLAFAQAQKEVDDLHQRTREGMLTAKLNGKQIGQERGRKLVVKKAATCKDAIKKYSKDFDGTLCDADCIRLIGIARNTYYKYKRELRNAISI